MQEDNTVVQLDVIGSIRLYPFFIRNHVLFIIHIGLSDDNYAQVKGYQGVGNGSFEFEVATVIGITNMANAKHSSILSRYCY